MKAAIHPIIDNVSRSFAQMQTVSISWAHGNWASMYIIERGDPFYFTTSFHWGQIESDYDKLMRSR